MKAKSNLGGQECPPHIALDRMYEYRCKLPRYQPAGRRLFITFRKNIRDPFSQKPGKPSFSTLCTITKSGANSTP
jgi:hypothetical protein